ncbi:uncharacterized protein LOC117709307 [Arvicanthis niloticus]|uniref:uncharacterized protein LOC117709307 n=1 Tax=Arvicanthis niloticus TaxID=61156 RepID=UPI00402B8442
MCSGASPPRPSSSSPQGPQGLGLTLGGHRPGRLPCSAARSLLPAWSPGLLLRWRSTGRPALLAPRLSRPLPFALGPFSDHVTPPQPPCPNFRTPLGTQQSNTPEGPRGRGPAGCNPASPRCAPDAAFAPGRVVRSCQLSMSRSPALLLLLRAPLDRIGQQCGACHWPGETVRALIGRARARGAPHSTVSERFETPHALLSACGMGGGAREGVREEERCKCRDKKFPCARERVNCS